LRRPKKPAERNMLPPPPAWLHLAPELALLPPARIFPACLLPPARLSPLSRLSIARPAYHRASVPTTQKGPPVREILPDQRPLRVKAKGRFSRRKVDFQEMFRTSRAADAEIRHVPVTDWTLPGGASLPGQAPQLRGASAPGRGRRPRGGQLTARACPGSRRGASASPRTPG
jgi:hypothetical protein